MKLIFSLLIIWGFAQPAIGASSTKRVNTLKKKLPKQAMYLGKAIEKGKKLRAIKRRKKMIKMCGEFKLLTGVDHDVCKDIPPLPPHMNPDPQPPVPPQPDPQSPVPPQPDPQPPVPPQPNPQPPVPPQPDPQPPVPPQPDPEPPVPPQTGYSMVIEGPSQIISGKCVKLTTRFYLDGEPVALPEGTRVSTKHPYYRDVDKKHLGFFNGSNCPDFIDGGATHFDVQPGSSEGHIYVKNFTAEVVNLEFSAGDLVATKTIEFGQFDLDNLSLLKAEFGNPVANTCHKYHVFSRRGSVTIPTTSDIQVYFYSNDVKFFSDAYCENQVISTTISRGSSRGTIYLRASKAGAHNMNIRAPFGNGWIYGPTSLIAGHPTSTQVAAVLVNYKNSPTTSDLVPGKPGCNVNSVNQSLFGSTNSLKSKFNTLSHGKLSITGTTQRVNYDRNKISCNHHAMVQEVTRIKNDLNLNNYDKIIIYSNIGCSAHFGMSEGGFKGTIHMIGNQGCGFNSLMSHEFGHTMNLGHADSISPTESYWNNNQISGRRIVTEQSLMNTSGTNVGFNGPHLSQLGWIPADKIAYVKSNQTVQLAATHLNPDSVNVKQLIKIRRLDASNETHGPSYYYVSLRRPGGVDANLPDALTSGVSIHTEHRGFDNGVTINSATVQVSVLNGYNKVFRDGKNKIKIIQRSLENGIATVEIRFE